MKIKKYLKRAACIAASAAMLTASGSATVYARDYYGYDCKASKISNPSSVQGEADGLAKGGDRSTSYNAQMAERGDSVYIAAYRNFISDNIDYLANVYSNDFSRGEIDALNNVITNGNVPEKSGSDSAYLMKYNKKSGEFTKIYALPDGTRISTVVTYGDDVYFSTYALYGTDLKRRTYKCDKNDKVEEVTAAFGAMSSVSQCIYNGKLYLAGIEEPETESSGWKANAAVVSIDKDGKLTNVASADDFGNYATNYLSVAGTALPSMGLTNYKEYIYITLPSIDGLHVFRGHPAADGEKANKFGWYWEEVAVEDAFVYGATFVFKDELYLYTCDNVLSQFVDTNKNIAANIFGISDVSPANNIEGLYKNLVDTPELRKFNDTKRDFEMCDGFTDIMRNTCNEYVWSVCVYNDELYLATMDTATVYGYLTKFAGRDEMTYEDLQKQIEAIKELQNYLSGEHIEGFGKAAARKLNELSAETDNLLEYLQTTDVISPDMIERYKEKFEDIMQQLKNLSDEISAEFDEETVQSALDYLKSKLNEVMEQGKEFTDGLEEIIGEEKTERIKQSISEFIEEMKNNEDLKKLPEQIKNSLQYSGMAQEYLEKADNFYEMIDNRFGEEFNDILDEAGEDYEVFLRAYINYNITEAMGIFQGDYTSELGDPVEMFGAEKAAQIEEKIPELIELERDPEYFKVFFELWECDVEDYEKNNELSEKLDEIEKRLDDRREEIYNELEEGIDDEYLIGNYVTMRVYAENIIYKNDAYLNAMLGEEKADELRQRIADAVEQLKNDEQVMADVEELKNMSAVLPSDLSSLDLTSTLETIRSAFVAEMGSVMSDIDEQTAEKVMKYFEENMQSFVMPEFNVADMLGQKKITRLSLIAAKYMRKLQNDAELQELILYAEYILSNPQFVSDIKDIYNSIDWDGLEAYARFAAYVNSSEAGFDLIKTSDGVTFELVTDNGFCDRYNYGAPSMIATDEGLYIGTANPFYGGQLWLLTTEANNAPVDNPPAVDPKNNNNNNNNNNNDNNSNNNSSNNNNNSNTNTNNNSGNDSSSPATGDGRNLVPVIAALMASAAVIALKKKKSAE